MSPKLPKDLLAVLASIDDAKTLGRVFTDLLTEAEITSIGERWEIAKLLEAGNSQRQVRDRLGVSVTTVNRGSKMLKYGSGGCRAALDVLDSLGGDS